MCTFSSPANAITASGSVAWETTILQQGSASHLPGLVHEDVVEVGGGHGGTDQPAGGGEGGDEEPVLGELGQGGEGVAGLAVEVADCLQAGTHRGAGPAGREHQSGVYTLHSNNHLNTSYPG